MINSKFSKILGLSKKELKLINLQFRSTKTQIRYIKKSAYNIRFIPNPSEEIQLLAISIDNVIDYIDNPTEKVQEKFLFNKEPYTIYLIHNPSEKIQLEQIRKDPWCILQIRNPTEKAKKLAIELDNRLFYRIRILRLKNPLSYRLSCKINEVPNLFKVFCKFCDYPTESKKLNMIRKNTDDIKYILTQTENMQLEFLKNGGWWVYLKNPSEKVLFEIIKRKPHDYDSIIYRYARNNKILQEKLQFHLIKSSYPGCSYLFNDINIYKKFLLRRNDIIFGLLLKIDIIKMLGKDLMKLIVEYITEYEY